MRSAGRAPPQRGDGVAALHAGGREPVDPDRSADVTRHAPDGDAAATGRDDRAAPVAEPDGRLVALRAARAAPRRDQGRAGAPHPQLRRLTRPRGGRGAVAGDHDLVAHLAVLLHDGDDVAPLGAPVTRGEAKLSLAALRDADEATRARPALHERDLLALARLDPVRKRPAVAAAGHAGVDLRLVEAVGRPQRDDLGGAVLDFDPPAA